MTHKANKRYMDDLARHMASDAYYTHEAHGTDWLSDFVAEGGVISNDCPPHGHKGPGQCPECERYTREAMEQEHEQEDPAADAHQWAASEVPRSVYYNYGYRPDFALMMHILYFAWGDQRLGWICEVHADGYGEGGGADDWSGVRDSSREAKDKMYEVVKKEAAKQNIELPTKEGK